MNDPTLFQNDHVDTNSEETSLTDATAVTAITEDNLNDSLQTEAEKKTENNESDCAQPRIYLSDSTAASLTEEDVRLHMETETANGVDSSSDVDENCQSSQENTD